MYIIINKTTSTNTIIKGNFPLQYLADLLNKGNEIIVISHYSNTIKVPSKTELNGIVEYDWNDFSFGYLYPDA